MSAIQEMVKQKEERELDPIENEFWKEKIAEKLKPITAQLTSLEEVKNSLRSVRNFVLVALFLSNIMWIIVMYTVTFTHLELYGFDARAFQLLFLAVYGLIVLLQFVGMVCHRGITLVHYFGRITLEEVKMDKGGNNAHETA